MQDQERPRLPVCRRLFVEEGEAVDLEAYQENIVNQIQEEINQGLDGMCKKVRTTKAFTRTMCKRPILFCRDLQFCMRPVLLCPIRSTGILPWSFYHIRFRPAGANHIQM